MAENDDGLFPVAVLIDELRHPEMGVRVKATRQLKLIAEALGFARTREELIPYLTDNGNGWDDDDEVLVQLAIQFGGFLDFVGGPEHAEVLLGPLEQLVGMEEPAVRTKAIEAIQAIVAQLPDKQLQQVFAPMVARLANHEWASCKAASAALIPNLYAKQRAPEQRQRLASFYVALCQTEEPIVKRAAAQHMPEMVAAMREGAATVMPLYSELGRDAQDGVRLVVIERSADLARQLAQLGAGGKDLVEKYVLQLVRGSVNDGSWRVRYMLCNSLKPLAEASGLARTPEHLTVLVRHLSEDREPEVRTAMAHQITTVGELLGGTRELGNVTPYFRELCSDENVHVRAAAAANIVGLSRVLGKEDITTVLLPLVQKLLQDEASEVRLNVIGELGSVSDTLGFKELSQHILPAVSNLAADPKWRVREGVIAVVPSLAKLMGPAAFDQDLAKVAVGWLTDQVCEIRSLVAKVLVEVWEAFGEQWALQTLLKKVGVLASKPNYMHRVSLLHFLACAAKSKQCSRAALTSEFLPFLQTLARDKVPNVRFNVAKTVEAALPKLDEQTILQHWKPLLDELERDPDHDVKHYARRAATLCP